VTVVWIFTLALFGGAVPAYAGAPAELACSVAPTTSAAGVPLDLLKPQHQPSEDSTDVDRDDEEDDDDEDGDEDGLPATSNETVQDSSGKRNHEDLLGMTADFVVPPSITDPGSARKSLRAPRASSLISLTATPTRC
jgi:hypothetical protein